MAKTDVMSKITKGNIKNPLTGEPKGTVGKINNPLPMRPKTHGSPDSKSTKVMKKILGK